MPNSSGNRRDRLASQVREVLAQCLLFEVKDPHLHSLSITDVEVSGDLGHAKVYYYSHQQRGASRKALDASLLRAKGFLRRRLGQEIRSRLTPDLAFYYDDSIEHGAAMEDLINQARSEDQRIAGLNRVHNPSDRQSTDVNTEDHGG